MATRVLIVDDDVDIREALTEGMDELGYATASRASAAEALSALDQETFDVVVTDVRMPSIDGIELCSRIEANHGVPVIVMTAFGDLSAVVDSLRAAAFDFITKPFDVDELARAVDRAVETGAGRGVRLLASQTREFDFSELIGSSPRMVALFEHLARMARTDASVLIRGESGTGKELIARALHRNSSRAGGPFVAVNCAAVPAELLESELFGHDKGAFTGATGATSGLFVQANGGTLFLDEVGGMPAHLQPVLLRALQERVVRHVGGFRETPFDVRVIAATNEDLEQAVRDGSFRDALLFRLNVLQVEGPPLRERAEDVIVLARHFLAKYAERHGGRTLELSDEAAAWLRSHRWPGNVRELQNCMEAAGALSRSGSVEPSDLPAEVRANRAPKAADKGPSTTLRSLKREQIERVLKEVGGNKAQAARVLGIDRVTLYRRIKRFANDRSAR